MEHIRQGFKSQAGRHRGIASSYEEATTEEITFLDAAEVRALREEVEREWAAHRDE